MRPLTVLTAVLAATFLLPAEARAQDMDSYLAAQIRRAEKYPQSREAFKEGKKDLKELRKALRKDGLQAYYELLREQMKEKSSS